MDKQQKNIERVVAGKALKDIHKIVEKDKIKEKQENKGAIVVGLFMLILVVLLLVLIFV